MLSDIQLGALQNMSSCTVKGKMARKSCQQSAMADEERWDYIENYFLGRPGDMAAV